MHTHTHTNGPDQPLQHVHTLLFLQLGSLTGVHADYLFIGLARTMYIRCIYGICGREITRYTVIYGVCIRFWPTLPIQLQSSRSLGNAAPISISHLTRCLGGSPYNVLASKVGWSPTGAPHKGAARLLCESAVKQWTAQIVCECCKTLDCTNQELGVRQCRMTVWLTGWQCSSQDDSVAHWMTVQLTGRQNSGQAPETAGSVEMLVF